MKMILVTLALINNSFAGDIVKKGEKLKEDSYVFTIEEAESLKNRVFDLEQKEKELNHYKELDILKSKKIVTLENSIEIYKKINAENEKIILNYAELDKQRIKNNRWDKFENSVIFISGVSTAIFLFITVDYINDTVIID